jgi:hypothetical protein
MYIPLDSIYRIVSSNGYQSGCLSVSRLCRVDAATPVTDLRELLMTPSSRLYLIASCASTVFRDSLYDTGYLHTYRHDHKMDELPPKAAATIVTFPRTLARNLNKDDVSFVTRKFITVFGAINSEHCNHTDRNIFANMFTCHVGEHVTSVHAA